MWPAPDQELFLLLRPISYHWTIACAPKSTTFRRGRPSSVFASGCVPSTSSPPPQFCREGLATLISILEHKQLYYVDLIVVWSSSVQQKWHELTTCWKMDVAIFCHIFWYTLLYVAVILSVLEAPYCWRQSVVTFCSPHLGPLDDLSDSAAGVVTLAAFALREAPFQYPSGKQLLILKKWPIESSMIFQKGLIFKLSMWLMTNTCQSQMLRCWENHHELWVSSPMGVSGYLPV